MQRPRDTRAADHTAQVDISHKAMNVINIISAWTVNTFYNYLDQEARALHKAGRAESITDGYKFIVKMYLQSFDTSDGYKRILSGLHKYYMDVLRCPIEFGEWVKEVVGQFVPVEYSRIMSDVDQDKTMRTILLSAIRSFSSEVVCSNLLDRLITNHGDPSLVPQMKDHMKESLIFERQRLYRALFKSSVGVADNKPLEAMKRELCAAIQENVLLKHKNEKLTAKLKELLTAAKARDTLIGELRKRNDILEGYARSVTPKPSPVETFVVAAEKATGLKVPAIRKPEPPASMAPQLHIQKDENDNPAPLEQVESPPEQGAWPVLVGNETPDAADEQPRPISDTMNMDMADFLMT
jgi:hypothetical protein